MRNALEEDIQKVQRDCIQKVQTEAGPHTDMASTQQHKKKFSIKKEFVRDYVRKKQQMQHSSKSS